MEKVTVATFNSELPAKSVQQRLTGVSIPAWVVDERTLQRFWFFSQPYAGIRLKVEKKNFERASEILERWDKEEGLLQDAIHCPSCGSSRIEYPQMTRYFILTTLLLEFFHFVGAMPYRFYCRTCQNTWRPRPVTEPAAELEKKTHPQHG